MQPFLDLRVIPSYGKFEGRVVWTVAAGFEPGRFTILKSPDGVNEWKEIGAVVGESSFVDPNLFTPGKFDETYYQVVLQHKGRRYDSPSVSTFGMLTRTEFGTARYIMTLEYKDLRQRTAVKVFKLKITADYCKVCTDQESKQQIGVSLCETCFGTGLEGGYFPGLDTFMRVTKMSPRIRNDSEEGTGSTDPIYFETRMLAFPPLFKDDLIVDPMTDRRFLVEIVNTAYMNGKAPIVSEVSLVLLPRNDVRYKLPLVMVPEPTTTVTTAVTVSETVPNRKMVCCSKPQLSFSKWINWNVSYGNTDLIGRGSCGDVLDDFQPGNGMYMALLGIIPGSSCGISTKQVFNFDSGINYRLRMRVAGNFRGRLPGDLSLQIANQVNVGNPVTTSNQAFTDYEWIFPGVEPGAIIINVGTDDADVGGIIIDEVELRRVNPGDSDVVLFYDNFDNENLICT